MTIHHHLRHLLSQATPGPWKIIDAVTKDPANYIFGISRILEGWDRESTVAFPATDCQHFHSTCIGIDRRDAELIAALRNHAELLLDVVEAAVAVVGTARELQTYAKRDATSLDAASEHDTAYRKMFAAVDALAKLEALP